MGKDTRLPVRSFLPEWGLAWVRAIMFPYIWYLNLEAEPVDAEFEWGFDSLNDEPKCPCPDQPCWDCSHDRCEICCPEPKYLANPCLVCGAPMLGSHYHEAAGEWEGFEEEEWTGCDHGEDEECNCYEYRND